MLDPTERFSDRADYYVRYRPRYPVALREFLTQQLELSPASVIADAGSGTGFLSELFLQNGNTVYGVEPNREMRLAAEDLLRDFPNFQSIDGTAEATTLPDRSVDFVTAGQAFHWFDAEKARVEFARILRPEGYVVLTWNEWSPQDSPFFEAYAALIRSGMSDYVRVKRDNVGEESLRRFFAPNGFAERSFANPYRFDWEGMRGRFLSASYAPLPGHPEHERAMDGLRQIFDRFQVDGQVAFPYVTRIYYGSIRKGA